MFLKDNSTVKPLRKYFLAQVSYAITFSHGKVQVGALPIKVCYGFYQLFLDKGQNTYAKRGAEILEGM